MNDMIGNAYQFLVSDVIFLLEVEFDVSRIQGIRLVFEGGTVLRPAGNAS